MNGAQFLQKSFSVATNRRHQELVDFCKDVGHTEPDAKGRCFRCGARLDEPEEPPSRPPEPPIAA